MGLFLLLKTTLQNACCIKQICPKSGKLTQHYDKNTLKLPYLWPSLDLH